MRNHSGTRLVPWVRRVVSVVVVAVMWVLFAPASLGGLITLVVVDGQSMEPMLSTGDLVVAMRKPSYAVGDLTVFEIGPGSRVIHRLVSAAPGDAYRTQGDNKPSMDPWIVPNEHIKGALLLAVPGAGSLLAWLQRTPIAIGLVAGAVVIAMFLPWGRRRKETGEAPLPARRRDEWTIAIGCLLGGTSCLLATVVVVRGGTAVTSTLPVGMGVGGAIAAILGTVLLTDLVGGTAGETGAERERIPVE